MTEESSSRSTPVPPISQTASAALESNLGLIHKVVNGVRMPDELRHDAFQEAALSFLDHYADYDLTRASLSTFMWPHLRGAVLHFLRSEARFPACTDDGALLEGVASGTLKQNGKPLALASNPDTDPGVTRFLKALDLPDRALLFDLYWCDVPLSTLARSMGVSRQSLHVRRKRLVSQARAQLSPAPPAA